MMQMLHRSETLECPKFNNYKLQAGSKTTYVMMISQKFRQLLDIALACLAVATWELVAMESTCTGVATVQRPLPVDPTWKIGCHDPPW